MIPINILKNLPGWTRAISDDKIYSNLLHIASYYVYIRGLRTVEPEELISDLYEAYLATVRCDDGRELGLSTYINTRLWWRLVDIARKECKLRSRIRAIEELPEEPTYTVDLEIRDRAQELLEHKNNRVRRISNLLLQGYRKSEIARIEGCSGSAIHQQIETHFFRQGMKERLTKIERIRTMRKNKISYRTICRILKVSKQTVWRAMRAP